MFRDLRPFGGVLSYAAAAVRRSCVSDNEVQAEAHGRRRDGDGLLPAASRDEWAALRPRPARVAWLRVLVGWLAALGCLAPEKGAEIVSSASWDMPARTVCASADFVRVVVALARVCLLPSLPAAALQTLAGLRADAAAWCRPPGRRAHRQASPALGLLFQATGWSMALLMTRVQADGSAEERRWARRRMAGMNPALSAAVVGPPAPDALRTVSEWMLAQAAVATQVLRDPAAVYALTSRRAMCIGVTAQRGATDGRAATGLPTIRGWQH